MAEYVYVTADALTGRFISELPLKAVRFELGLNTAEVFSADLPLAGMNAAVAATEPSRTCLYIVRGAQIVWGGFIWGRQYDSGSATLKLSGRELFSYLDKIRLEQDVTFTNVEQLAIARWLISYAMGKPSSNMRFEFVDPIQASGVLRDRTYVGADLAPIGQRVRELAAVQNGFDVRLVPVFDGNAIKHRVVMGYPSLGQTYPASQLVIEYGANAGSYGYNESGGDQSNVVIGQGRVPETDPPGSLPPRYTAVDPVSLSAGYPRLENAITPDVITATYVQIHTLANLATYKNPLVDGSLVVNDALDPELGSYLPGDEFRLIIPPEDPRAKGTGGIDAVMRIKKIGVTVKDDGGEDIAIDFNTPNIAE